MMWRSWKINLWSMAAAVLLAGCGKSSAENRESPETGANHVSIQYLKSLYKGYPYEIIEDLTIAGRIISTDLCRSFRYSLIIEDETGGIEVKVGMERVGSVFASGRKVLVRCAGLVLGSYGGSLQLGSASEDPRYECGLIPAEEANRYIMYYGDGSGDLTPSGIGPADFSLRYVNCLLRFDNVQFDEVPAGEKWNDTGEYLLRNLTVCGTADTVPVRVPPVPHFYNNLLPAGQGRFIGILRYFAGDYYMEPECTYSFGEQRERCQP